MQWPPSSRTSTPKTHGVPAGAVSANQAAIRLSSLVAHPLTTVAFAVELLAFVTFEAFAASETFAADEALLAGAVVSLAASGAAVLLPSTAEGAAVVAVVAFGSCLPWLLSEDLTCEKADSFSGFSFFSSSPVAAGFSSAASGFASLAGAAVVA